MAVCISINKTNRNNSLSSSVSLSIWVEWIFSFYAFFIVEKNENKNELFNPKMFEDELCASVLFCSVHLSYLRF